MLARANSVSISFPPNDTWILNYGTGTGTGTCGCFAFRLADENDKGRVSVGSLLVPSPSEDCQRRLHQGFPGCALDLLLVEKGHRRDIVSNSSFTKAGVCATRLREVVSFWVRPKNGTDPQPLESVCRFSRSRPRDFSCFAVRSQSPAQGV